MNDNDIIYDDRCYIAGGLIFQEARGELEITEKLGCFEKDVNKTAKTLAEMPELSNEKMKLNLAATFRREENKLLKIKELLDTKTDSNWKLETMELEKKEKDEKEEN